MRERKPDEATVNLLMMCMRQVGDPLAREAMRAVQLQLERSYWQLGIRRRRELRRVLHEFSSVAQSNLPDVTSHYLKRIQAQLLTDKQYRKEGWMMSIWERFRDIGKQKSQSKADAHERKSLTDKSSQVDRQLSELETRMVELTEKREALSVQMSVLKSNASTLNAASQDYQNLRVKASMLAGQLKTLDTQIDRYRETLLSSSRYGEMMRQGLANMELKPYLLDVPELEVQLQRITDANAEQFAQANAINEALADSERAMNRQMGNAPLEDQLRWFDQEVDGLRSQSASLTAANPLMDQAPTPQKHIDAHALNAPETHAPDVSAAIADFVEKQSVETEAQQ